MTKALKTENLLNNSFWEHTGVKTEEYNSKDTYIISTTKLIVLSLATFGLFELYWFYRQWRSMKDERNLKNNVWLNSIFSSILSYKLFEQINKAEKSVTNSSSFSPAVLALCYFVLVSAWRLPEPYDWISLLSFLPLIPVQNSINNYWLKAQVPQANFSKFGGSNWIWSIIGAIVFTLALYGTFFSS